MKIPAFITDIINYVLCQFPTPPDIPQPGAGVETGDQYFDRDTAYNYVLDKIEQAQKDNDLKEAMVWINIQNLVDEGHPIGEEILKHLDCDKDDNNVVFEEYTN